MRRKIWEHQDYQCSIVGTCLSLAELHKLARQTGLRLDDPADEFAVHVTFVKLCTRQGPVAKAVQKLLDRKFAGAVRRFSQAKGEHADLQAEVLWREAQAKGDIPGPYWAMMTHGEISHALRTQIFGEVHMLSHLVGAANRADIRRLAELEQQLSATEKRHSDVRSVYRRRLRDVVAENRGYKHKVAELSKELECLRGRAKEHGSDILRLENQGLQRSMATQSVMLMEQRSRNESLARKLEAQARRLEHMAEELTEKRAELQFLEGEYQRLSEERCPCPGGVCNSDGTPACGEEQCPGPSLCGKRILYVGGRANLVHHYRALVERRGGEFLHHDGGLEQSRHCLPRLLGGVDAVLCPVDCVSHDACLCVKEVCKHTMKPCKMLRSSGLSSLLRSLEELAAQPETQRRS